MHRARSMRLAIDQNGFNDEGRDEADTNGRNQLLMIEFLHSNAERSLIQQELASCSENGTEASLINDG